MQLSLVVPGLLALPPAVLAGSRALGQLAGAAMPRPFADGIEAAALEALMLDLPVAPLMARGAGLAVASDYLLCADPVTLVARPNDVRLTARVDDLDADEARALRELLNTHFAGDGVVFETPRADAWFVRVVVPPELSTTPLARATDRALRPLLPGGRDGGLWQRWQNEIQMLLFEHPVNAAREARGRAPVSGIWFWGGGSLAQRTARIRLRALAVPGREGDLLRGIADGCGGTAEPLPPTLAVALREANDGDIAAALPRVTDETALADFVRDWLQPSLAQLHRGSLQRLALVADGHGAAGLWSTGRQSLFRRLKARVAAQGFAVPVGDSSA